MTDIHITTFDVLTGERTFVTLPPEEPDALALADAEAAHQMRVAAIRSERDALLAATDWTQLADAPVNRAAWAAYRTALRDLPANTPDPAAVVFPEPPLVACAFLGVASDPREEIIAVAEEPLS